MVTDVDGAYAGDVSPQEAFELLRSEDNAALIDVRTQAEWAFVGVVDLGSVGKTPLLVEWQRYPKMERNQGFVEDVEAALGQPGHAGTGEDNDRGVDPIANPITGPIAKRERALLFLCRSGVRSIAAAEAMAARGYTRTYNVMQGFEGGLDGEGHRGAEGWKAGGLPWLQR